VENEQLVGGGGGKLVKGDSVHIGGSFGKRSLGGMAGIFLCSFLSVAEKMAGVGRTNASSSSNNNSRGHQNDSPQADSSKWAKALDRHAHWEKVYTHTHTHTVEKSCFRIRRRRNRQNYTMWSIGCDRAWAWFAG